MGDLGSAARTLLEKCMGAKAGESVLVVDDDAGNVISAALIQAATEMALEPMRITMAPRQRSGQEPPKSVSRAMQGADIVLMPTSFSLSHTNARHDACDAGARVGSMPGITVDMFTRTLTADYERVAERSETVARIMNAGREARITSALGTDLRLNIAGREGVPDTGLYHAPGAFGNLPAGEAYLAPVEGKAEGVLVVDASMAGLGVLPSPVTLTFREGRVVDVSGHGADQLRANWAAAGEGADCVAELGVGTNDRAVITGRVLEDEKVLGTVHIAVGNNAHFGGVNNVPYHADGVITKPTLVIDGTTVIENGVPRF
ncbi:MAG TPA: aminopeptidase [Armatimonadota bacterium]|jgi:leucyl aminopeptidase (aminopeptidase T)